MGGREKSREQEKVASQSFVKEREAERSICVEATSPIGPERTVKRKARVQDKGWWPLVAIGGTRATQQGSTLLCPVAGTEGLSPTVVPWQRKLWRGRISPVACRPCSKLKVHAKSRVMHHQNRRHAQEK